MYNPNLFVLAFLPILNHGLTGHHILAVDMFKKEQLKDVFDIAHDYRRSILADRSLDHILRVSIFDLFFFFSNK